MIPWILRILRILRACRFRGQHTGEQDEVPRERLLLTIVERKLGRIGRVGGGRGRWGKITEVREVSDLE